MKVKLLIAIQFLFIFNSISAQKESAKDKFSADSLDGVYIPKDIYDCFNQIDSFWPDSIKMKVRKWSEQEFASSVHMGSGMWMRNNWQLWGGSRLSKYFNEIGVFHPDDMSGIILHSYYRHLTGKELNLQKQIDYYKIYWTVTRDPIKGSFPNGARKVELHTLIFYATHDSMPGCIHLQTNSKTDKRWIYDYNFGWKEITENEKLELDSIGQEKIEDYLRKIFNK